MGAQQIFGPSSDALTNQVLLAGAPGFGTYRSPGFSCGVLPNDVGQFGYVHLSSGRSENELKVPEGAQIEPGSDPSSVVANHLIVYVAECGGSDIPRVLQGGDPRGPALLGKTRGLGSGACAQS